ncbi:MAG: transposase [Planctomycetes bacterium]|nr:transposase [Planctomycetota bacterium]
MNRGIARRPVFQTQADARRFLALLTCCSRNGSLRVYAYVLMMSHFHLLVRSLDGNLSRSMGKVLNAYVRSFNRSRHRDGPLFRGRFLSCPVRSRSHERTIIRYIDQNPVDARIVSQPHLYRFGSARELRAGNPRRRCLSMELIDWHKASMPFVTGTPEEVYDALYGPQLRRDQVEWIERRVAHGGDAHDELDDLLAATTDGVRNWATRRARIADGKRSPAPLVMPSIVDGVIERAAQDPWPLQLSGARQQDALTVAHASLLADVAGQSQVAITQRLACSATMPARWIRAHRRAIHADPLYARRYAILVRRCLQRMHGELA